MKVFLTGGTGFIGQALVRAMRLRNWDVTVLVRNRENAAAAWIVKQGARLAQGDVTNPQGLASAMAGADVTIHNAGVVEIGADAATARRMQAVNVGGTENILSAASAAQAPRTVFVSSVWALGPSGRAPAPSAARDETQRNDGNCLTLYERSKLQAHRIALEWRERGLPLVIAMPNVVVGANDHSPFGYLLRLTILGLMTPVAFGADAVWGLVDVDALADGLCLAAERARIGEDFVFSGEPTPLRQTFETWARESGARPPRFYLPRGVMRPAVALLEPLQRLLDLPAFLSREAVDLTRAHFDYSSAKAQRDLGWSRPDAEAMWPPIVRREKALMARRQGLLNKLRHVAVAPE
ncbi:MAG: SDR family NAD(P)-dependent oxidoreductase [Roseiarcus sp.]|jgi:dihydroflavonol-4-reductase